MPQRARSSPDASSILKAHGQAVAAYLRSLRDRHGEAPVRLLDAIDYSLLAGGKRLRPVLVLECCRACGGDAGDAETRRRGDAGKEDRGKGGRGDGGRDTGADRGDSLIAAGGSPRSCGNDAGITQSSVLSPQSSALAAAGAIELIHTFSLVHDDLPAMDDDDLRRGRPTNHKVFGEAMAILAGDAMVTMAFELISNDAEPSLVGPLVRELAHASGPAGMIGGQVLDMDGEGQSLSLDQLKRVHRLKTGALLTAACRLGAISAGAAEGAAIHAITNFGNHLGLAFQIIDDILDVTSTPEDLGKATGKDASKGKNTYPGLLGLEASRREARAQLDAALASLAELGSAADGLHALARFVVDRKN